MDLRNRIAYLE